MITDKERKIETDLRQTEEETKLLGKLEDLYKKRLAAMQTKYRTWSLNNAFVRGHHWLYYDPNGTIKEVKASKLPRITANFVGKAYHNTISMLATSNPTPTAIPASNSPEDQHRALSAQIHLRRIDEVSLKQINDTILRGDILKCGVGWKLVYWNSKLDSPLKKEEELKLETTEDYDRYVKKVIEGSGKSKEPQERYEGDVDVEVCSPYSILVDYPTVRRSRDIRDFIYFKWCSIDHIKENYPDKAKFVSTERIQAHTLNALLGTANTTSRSDLLMTEGVCLKQYFEAPTKEHKKGRLIKWANGVLLEDTDLPHPDGKLGLLDYHWSIDSDDFFGHTYLEDLVPLNAELNRIKTKFNTYVMKIARWRSILPRNARISRTASIDADDAEVYEASIPGGVTPHDIKVPEVPQGIFTYEENLKKDFSHLAKGLVAPEQSEYPRMDSAQAFAWKNDRDTQYVLPFLVVWETREKQEALLKLEFMAAYYHPARSQRILGENRNVEVYDLAAADLSPMIDIEIIKGSSMPRTKGAQNQFILELFKNYGLFGDMRDPNVQKRVMRLLDLGTGLTEAFGDLELGVNLQEDEMLLLKKGQDVEVKPYHEHPTHSLVCLRYLNSLKAKQWPPEVLAAVEKHYFGHVKFMMKAAQPGGVPAPEAVPPAGNGQPESQPQEATV